MISLSLKTAGWKTGTCTGLTTAYLLKSFLCRPHLTPYSPTPNTSLLTDTHAHPSSEQAIQGADGSQCVWDRRACVCALLVNRESGSLTCRQCCSVRPGESTSLYSELGDSKEMTMCSLPLRLPPQPFSTLGEDGVQLRLDSPLLTFYLLRGAGEWRRSVLVLVQTANTKWTYRRHHFTKEDYKGREGSAASEEEEEVIAVWLQSV